MGTKKFSPKRNFSKKNIEKILKNKPIVYKLKNAGETNLYTGIAKLGRVDDRLKEHLLGGKDPIKGARQFQTKQFKSIDQARREEKKIIKKEKPKYNK
ncbi:MAG TPA: hypothetical protein ENI18_08710 [Candidatus Aminicenantes bacterium]|nr:hypothetical protein [Candidatus Aminicenantes bacterium]